MKYFVTGGAGFIGRCLKNRRSLLIFIFIISFTLRLGFSLAANFHTSFGNEWDTDGYGRIASNLLEGNGYVFERGGDTVLIRGPIYPFLLLLLQLMFGSGIGYKIALLLVYSIMGSLLCILVFLIAEKIFSYKVGFFSALAVALHPLLIWYTGRIFIATSFAFLLAILIWYLLRALEKPTVKRFFGLGIILGIATLTYSIMLLFPLFVLIGIWTYTFHQKRTQKISIYTLGTSSKMVLVTVLGMILIIIPWTIRNYSVSNELVLVTTGGGYNFLTGNYFVEHYNANNRSSLMLTSIAVEKIDSILARKGSAHPQFYNLTASQDKYLNQVALESVKGNPLGLLSKIVKQFLCFWCLGASETKTRILSLLQLPILFLAGFGIFFSYTRKKNSTLLILVIVYFNLLYAAIHAEVRYSVPVVPYVLILAVYGLSEIFSCFTKKQSRKNLVDQLELQLENRYSSQLKERIVQ